MEGLTDIINKNDAFVFFDKSSAYRIIDENTKYARANKTDLYDFIRVATSSITDTYITGDDGSFITGDDGEYITED